MHTTHKLSEPHVVDVFYECLLQPNEAEAGEQYIFVVGIGEFNSAQFHAVRVEAHRQEIAEMLADLPSEFQESIGVGEDMRMAVYHKQGWRWTTELDSVFKLIQLGVATKQVQCNPVRHFWQRRSNASTYFYVKHYTL